MTTNNESDIDSDICCRADYKTEYTRDIINTTNAISANLNSINDLLNTASNTDGAILLTDFATVAKIRHHFTEIKKASKCTKRIIYWLERELIENEV